MALLGVAEVVDLLPMSPGSGYGGSWVGWMMRATLAPILGMEAARDVVARALGPGHDYHCAMMEATKTPRRNRVTRSDKGTKRKSYKRLAGGWARQKETP